MDPSALIWIAIVSALVAVGAAVAAVFIVRRGADADLKGDVNELAQMVERISREARREKMRKVRAGQKADTGDVGTEIPVPPGAEHIPLGGEVAPFDKNALRRRLMAARS